MWLKALLVTALCIIFVAIMFVNREPPLLTEVKRRFEILIASPDVSLAHRPIITGGSSGGAIGTNVNKGAEITLCLDGGLENINSVMNVFLHELAHQTVSEYDHSEEFWKNFEHIKKIAIKLGIYQPIRDDTMYCGQKLT